MPGVSVLDMGYKMSLNGVDNARLSFDNVKVFGKGDMSGGLGRLAISGYLGRVTMSWYVGRVAMSGYLGWVTMSG